MGQTHSAHDRDLYKQLKCLLSSSPSQLSKQELKNLLEWTLVNFPNADRSAVFTRDFWDIVGIRLFNNISRRDMAAAELVPACRALVELFAAKAPPAAVAPPSPAPSAFPPLAAASLQHGTPHASPPDLAAPVPAVLLTPATPPNPTASPTAPAIPAVPAVPAPAVSAPGPTSVTAAPLLLP